MSELANNLRFWAKDSKLADMLRADLLAAAEIIEAAEWREIETAPKDGTMILAVASDLKPTIVYYDERHKLAMERWRISRASGTHLIKPTHWWPLPSPPEKGHEL